MRSMERNIGSVCRAVAVKVYHNHTTDFIFLQHLPHRSLVLQIAENQDSNSSSGIKLPIIATEHTLEDMLGVSDNSTTTLSCVFYHY